MALRININPTSLRAQQNLSKAQNALTSNIERLSSGLRINRAGDDASGSSLSSKLTSDTTGLKMAARNSNDAISLIQTAEGAMGEINGLLQRMRELAVQSANGGTLTSAERVYIDQEFQLLESEINRIVGVTEFNGNKLIDGNYSTGIDFQVGMNNSLNDRLQISIADNDSTALGLNDDVLTSQTGAQAAINALDTAIQSVATSRSTMGTTQNRLTVTLTNLANMHENLSAANSRIKDVDVAEESAGMTRNQILQQAGVAVLAQANSMPQAALSLIGNKTWEFLLGLAGLNWVSYKVD
jgi:flagellin